MSFPKLSLATLPPNPELHKLSGWETDDKANMCISVWQYAKVLLALDSSGAISDHVKKILKKLYTENSLLRSSDFNENVNLLLGSFAATFLENLRNEFPSLQFPQPYSGTGNVFWQVILDLCKDENNYIYFCLRSRFRAALASCFGDDVIRNW